MSNELQNIFREINDNLEKIPNPQITEVKFVKYILPIITGQYTPPKYFLSFLEKLLDEDFNNNTLGVLSQEIDIIGKNKIIIATLPPFQSTEIIDIFKNNTNQKIKSALKSYNEQKDHFATKTLDDNIVSSIKNGISNKDLTNEDHLKNYREKLLKVINIYYPYFTFENKDLRNKKDSLEDKNTAILNKEKSIVENNESKKKEIDPDEGLEWE